MEMTSSWRQQPQKLVHLSLLHNSFDRNHFLEWSPCAEINLSLNWASTKISLFCTHHWQKSPRSGQREIQAAAHIVWKNTSPPNWITPTSICGWQRAVSISSLAALHLISSSSHPSNSTKSKHTACERRVFVSWVKFPLATHPLARVCQFRCISLLYVTSVPIISAS